MAKIGKALPRTKTAVAATLAAGIDAHLSRIERDPRLNPGKRYDKLTGEWISDAAGVHDFYGSSATGERHRVRVIYVAYQRPIYLSIEEAVSYLAWLDAGNVGPYFAVLRKEQP